MTVNVVAVKMLKDIDTSETYKAQVTYTFVSDKESDIDALMERFKNNYGSCTIIEVVENVD